MINYIAYPAWISPYVFNSLPIRWYSMMYLVAFALTYILFIRQRNRGKIAITNDDTLTLFLYTITGLIVGARLFSALLYEGSSYYWLHPWLIFWPFRDGSFVGLPGMSYHGGLVGSVVGALLFSRRYKFSFLHIGDVLVTAIPLGYTAGRLGNFINGELWGRITTAPWGMIFPASPRFSTNLEWVRNFATSIGMEFQVGDLISLPRHPSQLYEALFEGIILFIIMYFIVQPRRKWNGFSIAWYLIGYGVFRFIIEYVRQPDSHLGYIITGDSGSSSIEFFQSLINISMGQILSLLMIASGIIMLPITKKMYLAEQERLAKSKQFKKKGNRRKK
ncbi:MAG: prolipoprotein diacylglyceryl transferase [Spirochaetia bacterium]|nr:prolipoprotein diacylglyceryl transferase [Spirochaetia bacterium]